MQGLLPGGLYDINITDISKLFFVKSKQRAKANSNKLLNEPTCVQPSSSYIDLIFTDPTNLLVNFRFHASLHTLILYTLTLIFTTHPTRTTINMRLQKDKC